MKKSLKKEVDEKMDFPEEIPGSGVEFLFRLFHNIIAEKSNSHFIYFNGTIQVLYSLDFLTEKNLKPKLS